MAIPKIIGLSGVAGAGKDTFLELLSVKLPKVKRFALADNLKRELNLFFQEQYGLNIFTCSREEKELLRPILVAHGKIRRMRSQGQHWTSMLEKEILSFLGDNSEGTAVVTDIRYSHYPKDEVQWLKSLGGTFVHIRRYTTEQIQTQDEIYPSRKYIEPPNEDERENDPKLIKAANYRVEWPTVKKEDGSIDKESLSIYVDEFIKYLKR